MPASCAPCLVHGASLPPLKDLRFRCTSCGSSLTDHVTMAKDALRVQPWRHEAGKSLALNCGTAATTVCHARSYPAAVRVL